MSIPYPTRYPDPRDLLTRDEFRAGALARDKGLCVFCAAPASEVHHLIERRLFADGGYYLDNAASLCNPCHQRAETTDVSVDTLRAAAGITVALYPPGLARDEEIDKWGNYVDHHGRVHPGPLFDDQTVQRLLPHWEISTREKYPRTPHLPYSPGASPDDIVTSDAGFVGREVVVTEKMDGECTTIGRDADGVYVHARSLDSGPHLSRTWVKRLAARVGAQLDDRWRLVGENLQATHTVLYRDLPGYFLCYAVVDEKRTFLSWDDVEEYCALLDVPTAPVLYRGPYDAAALHSMWPTSSAYCERPEGYVVRLAESFSVGAFTNSVAKYVDSSFSPTGGHWQHRPVSENGLAPDARTV
jgi:hypothetical protein